MPGTIEQEILTQEESLTQAKRQLDISAFDRIYADDVMMTGVTGEVCGKASLLTEAARGVSDAITPLLRERSLSHRWTTKTSRW